MSVLVKYVFTSTGFLCCGLDKLLQCIRAEYKYICLYVKRMLILLDLWDYCISSFVMLSTFEGIVAYRFILFHFPKASGPIQRSYFGLFLAQSTRLWSALDSGCTLNSGRTSVLSTLDSDLATQPYNPFLPLLVSMLLCTETFRNVQFTTKTSCIFCMIIDIYKFGFGVLI